MIRRIKSGDDVVFTVTDEERESALRDMYEGAPDETSEVLERYLEGESDLNVFLALEEEELDPDDGDEVSDALWGRWLVAQLGRDNSWTERHPLRAHAGVRVFVANARPGGEWVSGPVQVLALHGDKARSWIRCTGWGDVREALQAARREEEAALKEIDRKARMDRERFNDIRSAHRAVLNAEKALEKARTHRARIAQEHVDEGDSMYRLAKEVGISAQAVAKWVG